MSRNTIDIVLFNEKLKLYQRSVEDMLIWLDISKRTIATDNFSISLLNAIVIVHDSLKQNYINLPFYKFIKKFKLKRLVSKNSLKKKLSVAEINKLAEDILLLEEIMSKEGSTEDIKKKL